MTQHQRTLLYSSTTDQNIKNSLFNLIKQYKSTPNLNDRVLTAKDFHQIRYSYILQLFDYYRLVNEEFQGQLKQLKSWYIWNIYKQLSTDILEKSAEMKYSDIEQNFK